jgi:hypothetical protein
MKETDIEMLIELKDVAEIVIICLNQLIKENTKIERRFLSGYYEEFINMLENVMLQDRLAYLESLMPNLLRVMFETAAILNKNDSNLYEQALKYLKWLHRNINGIAKVGVMTIHDVLEEYNMNPVELTSYFKQ